VRLCVRQGCGLALVTLAGIRREAPREMLNATRILDPDWWGDVDNSRADGGGTPSTSACCM
jgi:hypothetical protein